MRPALRFAALGATRIALGYMRGDRAAEETAAELADLGVEPTLVRGNVASTRVADEVAALGPLDVFVHAAATGVIRPALETEEKHWDWTLAANARAFLSLTRAAAPSMPEGAAIVAISSLGSTRVLEDCYLRVDLDACARIVRTPSSLVSVDTTLDNLTILDTEVETWDLGAAYALDTRLGHVELTGAATYLGYYGESGRPAAGDPLDAIPGRSPALASGNVAGLSLDRGLVYHRLEANLGAAWSRGS